MNYTTYNKASKLRCRERGRRRVIPQKALKVQNYILIIISLNTPFFTYICIINVYTKKILF